MYIKTTAGGKKMTTKTVYNKYGKKVVLHYCECDDWYYPVGFTQDIHTRW